MEARVVRLVAPSRLHFGMLSVNPKRGRQYGGVGAMIARPGIRLRFEPAPRLQTVGPLAGRAMRVLRHLLAEDSRVGGGDASATCRVVIESAPREHVGLGTGTQLSMSLAAGLHAFRGRPALGAAELARRVRRGGRSAVGLHGFVQGGLLLETGKPQPGAVAPLAARVDIPEAWRFVLVCRCDESGLSGEVERRAFDRLAAVPAATTAHLERLAREQLLPAAEAAEFDRFSEALYEYGHCAGMIFAGEQGGAFAGPWAEATVRAIRELGIRGAGQSSWGPTLFAVLPDQQAAERLARQMHERGAREELEVTISPPDNRGARIECADAPS